MRICQQRGRRVDDDDRSTWRIQREVEGSPSYGPAWEYEDEPWGFDNGAWADQSAGREFDGNRFRKWLNRCRDKQSYPPIVAAVPDIAISGTDVGEPGLASLAFSNRWRRELPNDWPWFLVVQDGVCPERVRRDLYAYDYAGIFLGGTDKFKQTAPIWCDMAHRHNKLFHFGRCSRIDSWVRMALRIGADSMDTTRWTRAHTAKEKSQFLRFEQVVTGQCPQLSLTFPETPSVT